MIQEKYTQSHLLIALINNCDTLKEVEVCHTMKNAPKKLEKSLPKLTGIYLFKNKENKVLYIGKALNLHHRVNSYFQKYTTDWKVQQLLDEYADINYILTPTETEALLLESQLIQQYKPKFNVLLKQGQPFLYILFTKDEIPQVKLVRNKKKKGKYFGPFLQKIPTRKAYRFIMQTFRLNLCNKKIEHGCLDYHIDNCAGSCKPNFDFEAYCFRVNLAMDVLKNKHEDFVHKVEEQMKRYTQALEFEKAQHLNEYLQNLDIIFQTIQTHFNESKFATDIFVATTPTPYAPLVNKDIAKQLQQFLNLATPVRTIDCFDISHFQSRNMVGSCVRFTDGKPEKHKFRRFKIKTIQQQNDYAALQEIVSRRYCDTSNIPDLILIDGGKGQLNAVCSIVPNANCVSLAKRKEILYGPQFPDGIHLDVSTDIGKLLIALRDYAHHFAINYHRLRRKKDINMKDTLSE